MYAENDYDVHRIIFLSHSDDIFVIQALQIHSLSEPSVQGLGTLGSIQPCSSAILCHEESKRKFSRTKWPIYWIPASTNWDVETYFFFAFGVRHSSIFFFK